jgi:hypothetical protein
MNDDSARSRVVEPGQVRLCDHSRRAVPKKRSILPFQHGVQAGVRICLAPSWAGSSVKAWLV